MGAVIVGVRTLIHRVLSAVGVQGAMRGVMAIIAVVVGLLLLVGAKHAGILPEGLIVKAEARASTALSDSRPSVVDH